MLFLYDRKKDPIIFISRFYFSRSFSVLEFWSEKKPKDEVNDYISKNEIDIKI